MEKMVSKSKTKSFFKSWLNWFLMIVAIKAAFLGFKALNNPTSYEQQCKEFKPGTIVEVKGDRYKVLEDCDTLEPVKN